MADKNKRGYWCDKYYERISVLKGKIQCQYFKESELQTWCAMGRLPDECRVELAIKRGENPDSYEDWLRSITLAGKAASRRIEAFNKYLNSKEVRDAIRRVKKFHEQIFAKE